MPPLLCQRILLLSHYPPDAEHSDQRRVYNMLQREFNWLHITVDAERLVRKCQRWARYNPRYCQKRKLQLFPAAGVPKFIVLDILASFPKTTQHDQYIHVITDRYSKLKRASLTLKTTATHIANLSFTIGLYRTAFLGISSQRRMYCSPTNSMQHYSPSWC